MSDDLLGELQRGHDGDTERDAQQRFPFRRLERSSTATSGTCTVTMSQAQSVTAMFIQSGSGITFTSTTLPAGAVTVPYGADIQVTGGTQP